MRRARRRAMLLPSLILSSSSSSIWMLSCRPTQLDNGQGPVLMTTVAMPVFSTKNETVSVHTATFPSARNFAVRLKKHPKGIKFPDTADTSSNNDSFRLIRHMPDSF